MISFLNLFQIKFWRISIEKKTVFLTSFAGISLILILILFYSNAQKIKSTSNLVEHSQQVLQKSNDVFIDILNIESSSRGFILTGNAVFLNPYKKSNLTIYSNINKLKALTKDNKNQQLRIDTLKDVIDMKMAFTERTIDLRYKHGLTLTEELIGTGEGNILSGQIRIIIARFNNEEFQILEQRKIANKNSNYDFKIIYVLLLILSVFIFSVIIIIIKTLKAKNIIAKELNKTTDLFLNLFNYNPASISISRISDGKIINVNYNFLQLFDFESRDDVLNKTSKELQLFANQKYVEDILLILNDNQEIKDIETKIVTHKGEIKWISESILLLEVENTPCLFSVSIDITHRKKAEEELMAVNKELETFTYSVSHDLRAPLRAINGYAKIIQEDYASILDSDGIYTLNAILKNSKKMGQLIDDLLAFSRLGRKVIETSEIIMTSLVQSVIEEEMIGRINRENITFILPELLPAIGQQVLIRQVWVNLISNALKYSKNKPKIIIEIGSEFKDNSIIYSVKDNGAGFDMQYYDKLFGIFQRLHSQEEFEGTGIGLAIVQKIVTRNNGTVWAESKLNEGTCFYFSLPPIIK